MAVHESSISKSWKVQHNLGATSEKPVETHEVVTNNHRGQKYTGMHGSMEVQLQPFAFQWTVFHRIRSQCPRERKQSWKLLKMYD